MCCIFVFILKLILFGYGYQIKHVVTYGGKCFYDKVTKLLFLKSRCNKLQKRDLQELLGPMLSATFTIMFFMVFS